MTVAPHPEQRLRRVLERPALILQASSEEFDLGFAERDAVGPGQVAQAGLDFGIPELGCPGTEFGHAGVELPERPLDIGGREGTFLGSLTDGVC